MSRRIEFHFKPQGAVIDAYLRDRTRRSFICGPLGSGKTAASCWKGFRIMTNQAPDRQRVRRTRIVAVRNTYSDLLSTTAKDWRDLFEDLGKFKEGGREPPCHYLDFALPDRTHVLAELVFLALDREEHVKKLRGMQVTAVMLSEAKELPFGVVSMADLRTGRYPKEVPATWHGMFGDTNAPDTDHWYYKMAEETFHQHPLTQQRTSGPKGWKFFKQPGGIIRSDKNGPWRENHDAENTRNLPKDYYLEGAQGKADDWVRVNLANEYGFVREGKPVYPDYRDNDMCREFDLVPELGLYLGMDFGLTPALLVGQQTISGQWRIHNELCTEDTGIHRFAGETNLFMNQRYNGWQVRGIYGDPAGGQRQAGDVDERTVFQILQANNIACEPAPGNNDFLLRTEAFAAPMRRYIDGQPGLLIHPQCKVTRKGLQGGYAHRRVKVAGEERYRDLPDKNKYSHPCEAGQYMVLGAGEGTTILQSTSARADMDVAGFRQMMGYS